MLTHTHTRRQRHDQLHVPSQTICVCVGAIVNRLERLSAILVHHRSIRSMYILHRGREREREFKDTASPSSALYIDIGHCVHCLGQPGSFTMHPECGMTQGGTVLKSHKGGA